MKKTLSKQNLISAIFLTNELIQKECENINKLNVFPVPDGDTGTNISMTFNSGTKALATMNLEASTIGDIFNSFAKGCLMGARGNSGVILSITLKGFAKSIENCIDQITKQDLVNALTTAKENAYKAVMAPKEGTMLSIIRAAYETASSQKMTENIEVLIEDIVRSMNSMLIETEFMLSENTEAKTVDAGALGLFIILESLLCTNIENKIDISQYSPTIITKSQPNKSTEKLKYKYCTELFIKTEISELQEEKLKVEFQKIGNSLVVVPSSGITKIHVHTAVPNKVLEYALSIADISGIKIDNMEEQSEKNIYINKPQKELAVISICNGEGISNYFEQLGVDVIVNGGQSMNPSVEEMLEAVKQTNAKNIILLPNNKNILISAKQVSELAEENVIVVQTRTVAQGISACFGLEKTQDIETIISDMNFNFQDTLSFQIAQAEKSTTIKGIEITKNDLIGIKNEDIFCSGSSYIDILKDILALDETMDCSTLEIFIGTTAPIGLEKQIEDFLNKNCDMEFSVNYGGQEIYPVIISIN